MSITGIRIGSEESAGTSGDDDCIFNKSSERGMYGEVTGLFKSLEGKERDERTVAAHK
jgi:hypothetical protein